VMANGPYTFELKSNLSELDILCEKLESICQSLNLSQKCKFEINLALDELFTNIISYGFDDDEEHVIEITIDLKPDEVVLRVEDDGVPFNPVEASAPEVACSVENCRIGGLGIHLIRNLMDEICYRRCGNRNVLIMKKNIPAE
jgi:serine/threonine-protein kinase RsbW